MSNVCNFAIYLQATIANRSPSGSASAQTTLSPRSRRSRSMHEAFIYYRQHLARACRQCPPKKNRKPPETCCNFNRLFSANCERANKSVRLEDFTNVFTVTNNVQLPSTTRNKLYLAYRLPPTRVVHSKNATSPELRCLCQREVPFPLDSCCLVSLVSCSHAHLIAYRSLGKPVVVSIADAQLQTSGTMDISIQ